MTLSDSEKCLCSTLKALHTCTPLVLQTVHDLRYDLSIIKFLQQPWLVHIPVLLWQHTNRYKINSSREVM